MIFPDGQPVLGLDALLRDAGTYHLGQAVDVDRVDVELGLDRLAHRRRPRLGAEDPDLERAPSRVDSLALHLLRDRQHVRWGHHDDGGFEVGDELHLALGHPARHRDHGAAELLRAVVRTQPPGKQPVAVGNVHDVPRPAARGANRPRHDRRPDIDIAAGIADDSRLSGGPRRGMNANDLLARYGEHPERIMIAQFLLGGERQSRQITQRL